MEKYFLGLKSFPIENGMIQLSNWSSNAIRQLVLNLNNDFKLFNSINNIDEIREKVSSELSRFRGTTTGPPKFLQYLEDLNALYQGLDAFEKKVIPIKLNDEFNDFNGMLNGDEMDFSQIPSPANGWKATKPANGKFQPWMDKVINQFEDSIQNLVRGDPFEENGMFGLHLSMLNIFARLDIIQRESEEPIIVETAFVEEKEVEENKKEEVPLNPNHYQVLIHDLEVYSIYEKTKDAIIAIEAKENKGVKIPPLTSNKKIEEKVNSILEIEKKIFQGDIKMKDIGKFGWYRIRIFNQRPPDLWARASTMVSRKLPSSLIKARSPDGGRNTPDSTMRDTRKKSPFHKLIH